MPSEPRNRITPGQWTTIAAALGLSLLLLFGSYLPSRERAQETTERNVELAEDVLTLERENASLAANVSDLEQDPHTWERELRRRGALLAGEEHVPEIPRGAGPFVDTAFVDTAFVDPGADDR